MAAKPPAPEDQQHVASYVGVVLPNRPHELNFAMREAARIEGELANARSRPLPGQALQLRGHELYPASSVLAAVQTDDAGKFTVEDVPLKCFWFDYGRPNPAQSDSIDFTIPGTWQIKLEYRDPVSGKPALTLAVVQKPVADSPAGTTEPRRGSTAGSRGDQGAGGSALVKPGEDADVLEFRITPTPGEVEAEVVAKYRQTLLEGGRPPANDFAWFEVRPDTTFVPGPITCEQGGKTYLLLWNDPSHVMRTDGTWRLEDVNEVLDQMGNRSIILTLDEAGVQRLHQLGDANLRHCLAVLFEGRVITLPFINAPLSGRGLPIIAASRQKKSNTSPRP